MTPSDGVVIVIVCLAVVLGISTMAARWSRCRLLRETEVHPRFALLLETEVANDEWTRWRPPAAEATKEYPGAESIMTAGPGSVAIEYPDRIEVRGRVYPKGPLTWIDKEHFALIYKERALHIYWTASTIPRQSISLPKGFALSVVFDGYLIVYLGRPDLFIDAPGRRVIFRRVS